MSDPVQTVVMDPRYRPVGDPRPWGCDELGGLYFSKLCPDYFALSRAGKVFTATHTIATAVAPLQVVPTTTAAFVVNNVHAPAAGVPGKLVVPLFASVFLASGTAALGLSLWGQVGSTPLATQLTANDAGVTVGNAMDSGRTRISWVGLSKTVAGAWTCLGGMDCAAATTPGVGLTIPLRGMFVVQPTYAFGLHVLAGAGTSAAFTFSVAWAEVEGTCS
jgi:hypothetical protein